MKVQSQIIAFNLFREWTKNAAREYPEHDFSILDETALVDDFLSALNKAIESLVKEEKAENRKVRGYDFGYITGFIRGSLNLQWNTDYLMKQGVDYKEFTANKAILQYLKIDEIAALRINGIYEELLKQNTNVQSLDIKIKIKETKEYGLDELQENLDDKSKNHVQIYLNNMIDKQIVDLLNKYDGDYLPALDQFVNEEYVGESIKMVEQKK
jgi:hypothetical protein